MFSFNEFINPKLKKKSDPYRERLKIFNGKNKNLRFLLENRFLWMRPFLKNKKKIIEVGSGTGCIQLILKKKIILTDLIKYPWINKKINMTRMNLEKKYLNKVDIFIVNQTLHHCPNPAKTLKKMSQYLKKDGLILINEPEISIIYRVILYILKDEPWSLKTNIFNSKKNIFRSNNPWMANVATARLLFSDKKKFYHFFPQYKIIKNDLNEFFININSGGVNNDYFYIPLNRFFLKILNAVDKILIYLFPNIFAFNRSTVLKKIK